MSDFDKWMRLLSAGALGWFGGMVIFPILMFFVLVALAVLCLVVLVAVKVAGVLGIVVLGVGIWFACRQIKRKVKRNE